jgi:hypothetical protein
MPAYKIEVVYVDHTTHATTVWIVADTPEQALAEAKDRDDSGELDFREVDLDTDPASYSLVPVAPTPEEAALADMTAEYLGEG